MLGKLIFGDCLKVLKLIPDASVDMIFADLPYGTTKCKWDSCIDLGELWIQYKRIIKANGAILLFAQLPFDKVLGCSNLAWLRYEWVWEKTQATGHLNAKKMPMKAHENILVFYENMPMYNPQKTTGHKPINTHYKPIHVQNRTKLYGKATKSLSGGGETDRYPRDVLKFSSDKQKMKSTEFIHSTQKPLALVEYMIRTYTVPGMLVVDNTCGSGTTGVACVNTGNPFILIDNDIDEYRKAKKRIQKHINGTDVVFKCLLFDKVT